MFCRSHGRISCFHGRQTIKWLALTAAKLYEQQNHISGRVRQRSAQAKHQGQLRPGVVYLVKRTKKQRAGPEAGGDGEGKDAAGDDEDDADVTEVVLHPNETIKQVLRVCQQDPDIKALLLETKAREAEDDPFGPEAAARRKAGLKPAPFVLTMRVGLTTVVPLKRSGEPEDRHLWEMMAFDTSAAGKERLRLRKLRDRKREKERREREAAERRAPFSKEQRKAFFLTEARAPSILPPRLCAIAAYER